MAANTSLPLEDPGVSLLARARIEDYLDILVITSLAATVLVFVIVFRASRSLCGGGDRVGCTQHLPESVVLILVGAACSAGLHLVPHTTHFHGKLLSLIDARIIFNLLLPPIILNGAYQLYAKAFVYNLDGILLLAFVGTGLNILVLAPVVYFTYGINHGLTLVKCFILAAIVSAVDPAAVLDVFDSIGVNDDLYFLIFGESLFNDGVTIVVFETLREIAFVDDIAPTTYAFAVLSLLTVTAGGLLLGTVFGVLSALVGRLSVKATEVFAVVTMLTAAYLAFVTAQIISWSGIMALIACGLVQRRYAFANLTSAGQKTLESVAAVLAVSAETVIFLAIGLNVMGPLDYYSFHLVAIVLVLITALRFAVTYGLGSLLSAQQLRWRDLSRKYLFIMSYGGLRGAVSFVMVSSLSVGSEEQRLFKDLMTATTLAVIVFTVIVQGSTVKCFVDMFRLSKAEVKRLDEENEEGASKASSETEEMADDPGVRATIRMHSLVDRLDAIDQAYIRPWLTNSSQLSDTTSSVG